MKLRNRSKSALAELGCPTGGLEANLMQMILAKEKLNLFMKGDEADMDDIYERFGVDYDLTSLLLYRDIDEDGRFSIRWGEQEIA